MRDSRSKDVILCTGGSAPGISILDVFNSRVHPVISLKPQESIYAADISADGKVIVAGAKSGYLIYAGLKDDLEACDNIQRYLMAGSVLSVLFVNDHLIAASDSSGRVLLWDRDDEGRTRLLDSCKNPICSLFCPNDHLLGGLSIGGDLYLWDITGYDRPAVIQASEPPVIHGLVDIIFWRGLWAWPDYTGRIVLFDAESRHLDFLDAHSGSVYAICTYNDHLVSLGKSDGILKFWESGSNRPSQTMKFTHGAVSISLWDQPDMRCLTVDEHGGAQIRLIRDHEIVSTEKLTGNTYRKVIGPDQSMVTEYLESTATEQIEKLRVQIRQKIDGHDIDDLPLLYQKLDEGGAGGFGLWLAAYQAEKENDIYGQLERYHELYGLLEPDQRCPRKLLTKYMAVLKRTWQLEKAVCTLHEYAEEGRPVLLDTITSELLHEQAHALSSASCIIDPDIDLAVILKASKLLDQNMRGGIIYRHYTSCPVDGNIDPREFTTRYEDLRRSSNKGLPEARLENVSWLAGDDITQESVMILGPDRPGLCLDYIVKFTSEHSRTVIETAIALNAQRFYEMDTEICDKSIRSTIEPSLPIVEQNEAVRSAIKYLVKQYITKSESLSNRY